MFNLLRDIEQHLGTLTGSWATYAAFGTIGLYVFGYFSLHFHLAALGIVTDLPLLDERYLFAGVEFLVYLLFSTGVLVMLALILSSLLFFLLLPLRLLLKLLPVSFEQVVNIWSHFLAWWGVPQRLALTGIVIAVVLFQFMRPPLYMDNLLLSLTLPPPTWYQSLLVDRTVVLSQLYIIGLGSGTALTVLLLLRGPPQGRRGEVSSPSTLHFGPSSHYSVSVATYELRCSNRKQLRPTGCRSGRSTSRSRRTGLAGLGRKARYDFFSSY